MRKTILLFFCVCCFLLSLKAQTCQPTWTNYTAANSGILATNAIQGIAIDAAGNKWFTTGGSGGISKFDGTGWTSYTTGLPNMNCFGIGTDNSNNIWVGVNNNIGKFDGSTWTVYNSSNSGFPSTQEVRSIKTDASGNVWASTQSGLAVFNGSTWSVYNPGNSGIPSYGIMDVAFDATGKKWIATQGGGVSVFDGSTWTTYNTSNSGLPNNEVWAVAINPLTGDKWFGTLGGGVCKYNGSTWTVYNTSNSGLIHNNIRGISFDNDGRAYFGGAFGTTGVSVFDGSTWTNYTPSNSNLASGYTMDMATDAQGNVWVVGFNGFGASVITPCPLAPPCSNDTVTVTVNICPADLPYTWNGHTITATGAGVDTLFLQNAAGCDSLVVLDLLPQGGSWTIYTDTNSVLPSGSIQSMAMDHSGNIWATPANNGVAKFDGSTWTHYTTANSGLPNNSCFGIGVDNTGNMWIGTFMTGIVKFDGTNWTVYNSGNSGFPNTQEVREVKADAANNIWAPTQVGLAMFNGSTWTNYTTLNSGIAGDGIMDIDFDASGKKWIATQTAGVSALDGNTWTTYNTGNSGLTNNQVWAVDIDAAGNKWFGTWGGGVSKFDGSTWTTYNTGNSGLTSNMVRDIFIDQTGKIWIGTNAGVSMFDGSSWVTYTTGNSPLVSTFLYDILQDTQSRIWMGGFENVNFAGGISVFSDPCQPACTPTASIATHSACDSFTWINGVTYTAANNTATYTWPGGNAGGCDSVITLNLTIVPSPALSVTGSLTVCDGADLSDVSINDANNTGAVLAWFSDATCTTPVANPAQVTASGSYYAVGTAASCPDTVSVSITVNESPVLSVNGLVNSCQSVNLGNVTINDANATGATYTWFTDAACTTPVANPGHVTASGTYYVVGTAATCTDTVSVTVNLGMAPDLSIAATFHACDAMDLDTLGITDTNATGAVYAWYSDAACTVPVTNNILASGTYYAVGISGGCSDTVNTAVSINSTFTPSVTVQTDNLAVCAGSNVTFTAALTDGGSNPSYQWYKNGSPVGGNTGVYSTTSLTNNDEVYVVVSIPEPCAASASLESNHITVTVTPVSVPQVSITVAPGNIFTPGQPVTFTALASAAGSNPTFTWLKNGSPIPGAPTTTTYSTTNLQNGDVISCIVHSNAVCATPDNAVSNGITMHHVSGSGIAANEVWITVTVFPNPAHDVVNVSIDTQKNYLDATLRLVDLSGRIVWEQQRNIEAGKQQFGIETATLAQGMYHLHLGAGGQLIAIQKVMLVK